MNTILFTGYDDPYIQLARITWPRMAKYAHKHGMDFDFYQKPPPNLNMYWTGVARGLELLKDHNFERVIYLDVDQLVTNFDVNILAHTCLASGTSGFHVGSDWGNDVTEPWHFSMCGFIAHQDCIPLFEEVLSLEPEWRDKPFQEQGPFQDVVRRNLITAWTGPIPPRDPHSLIRINNVWIHPRKVFNCVPDQVSPGNVPTPWEKGNWCAHITMVDIPKRVEIANELIAQLT